MVSFNNQSDFAEQFLHTKTQFPSNSYIPSVHAFLFFPSWHCPLTMPMKKYLWKKIIPLFGLHYFPSLPPKTHDQTPPNHWDCTNTQRQRHLFKYTTKLNLVIYSSHKHSINLNWLYSYELFQMPSSNPPAKACENLPNNWTLATSKSNVTSLPFCASNLSLVKFGQSQLELHLQTPAKHSQHEVGRLHRTLLKCKDHKSLLCSQWEAIPCQQTQEEIWR